jgi:hypothetical protein
MRRTAILGISVMVGVAGLAGASNAAATSPGRGGELMYFFTNPHGKVIDGNSGVEAFGTRMKVKRPVFECSYFFTSVGSCFTFDAAVTADGESIRDRRG